MVLSLVIARAGNIQETLLQLLGEAGLSRDPGQYGIQEIFREAGDAE